MTMFIYSSFYPVLCSIMCYSNLEYYGVYSLVVCMCGDGVYAVYIQPTRPM